MKYVQGTKRVDPQTMVITCRGEMDTLAVEELHQAVDPLLAEDSVSHLVFDLAAVEYVSSSVLSFLMATQGKAQEKGGKVSLLGASSLVKQVFEMAALDSLFEFHGTLEELGIVVPASPPPKGKGKAARKEKVAPLKEEVLEEEREKRATPAREPQQRAGGGVTPLSRKAVTEVQKISPAPARRSWRDYGAWIGIAAVASVSLIVSLYFYLTR